VKFWIKILDFKIKIKHGSLPLNRNPDLTRLCDRLLEKDLVERTVNGKNRREVLLTITEKGIRLLDAIEPAFADATKVWDKLTPEEYETLSDLLDKLRAV
jgi:DNA-binding MarR family transcriptional regulator